MANKVKKSPESFAAFAVRLIAGVPKLPPSVTNIVLGGSPYTPAQLTSELQKLVSLRQDVDAARAATTAKVAAETAQAPALRALMSAFVQFLRAAFGNQPDVLALFGLEPRKAPTPLTTEQKAAAAAKRASTRAARGTKGPKALAKVKGTVTGVSITPLTQTGPSVPVSSAPNPAPNTTGTATGGGTTHTG